MLNLVIIWKNRKANIEAIVSRRVNEVKQRGKERLPKLLGDVNRLTCNKTVLILFQKRQQSNMEETQLNIPSV